MCVCVSVCVCVYSQTSLVQTLIFRKPQHTDGWTIKRTSHSVNVFISPDIQLPDLDSYDPQQSVKNKDNLLHLTRLKQQIHQ